MKDLTKHELLHLELISFGYSMKEIAAEMKAKTRATHEGERTRLFDKMMVKNSAEAVRVGFEKGILKPR